MKSRKIFRTSWTDPEAEQIVSVAVVRNELSASSTPVSYNRPLHTAVSSMSSKGECSMHRSLKPGASG